MLPSRNAHPPGNAARREVERRSPSGGGDGGGSRPGGHRRTTARAERSTRQSADRANVADRSARAAGDDVRLHGRDRQEESERAAGDTFSVALGARIREARLALGLSPTEFAAGIHASVAAVSMWESGRCEPRVRALRSIVLLTRRSADWLLGAIEAA